VSIERLQAFYGFTRMPFGRNLAPGMLHRHTGHAEAVARITWCAGEHALGVITGEVGAGKTVAVRAALTALDPTRHTLIYLGNPTIGARGIHHARSYGLAVAFRIGRHSHPKARPEHIAIDPPPVGIDYLNLIGAVHADTLGDRVNYAALTREGDHHHNQQQEQDQEQQR
jgi:hypothetical protein